jgi:hypothetical protein
MQQFLLIELGKLATLMAVQSAFDYILPIIGSLVSGLTVGGVTYRLLYKVLDGCISILLYFALTKLGSNPQSNTLGMKEPTITIPMRFLFNMIKLT